jgi:hypothetical protein
MKGQMSGRDASKQVGSLALCLIAGLALAFGCNSNDAPVVSGCEPSSGTCDGGSQPAQDASSEPTPDASEEPTSDTSEEPTSDAPTELAPEAAEAGETGTNTATDASEGGETNPVCGCGSALKLCGRRASAPTPPSFYCAPRDFGHSCDQAECDPCVVKHAHPGCSGGVCGVGTCVAGWGDCNQNSVDGCEMDLTTPTNCGACGHACASGEKCLDGACAPACNLTQTDCNGACTDLATSAQHCGACTNVCDADCVRGVCSPFVNCPAGQTACDGVCVDLSTDPSNCGACGHVCAGVSSGATCSNGACAPCPNGLTACDSRCLNLKSDLSACGACGQTCLKACWGATCDDLVKAAVVTGIQPDDMALDDQGIYFVESQGGTVSRVDKSGGTPLPLASSQAQPWRLAVDDQFVYFTNKLAAVMRVSKSGGDATPLAMGNQPMGIAIDTDTVYFANSGAQTIMRVSKTGGDAAPVVMLDASPSELVLDDSRLFFRTSERAGDGKAGWHIAWTSVAGGEVHWIAGDIQTGCSTCCKVPPNFAVSGDAVYWACFRSPDVTYQRSLTTDTGAIGTMLMQFYEASPQEWMHIDGGDLFYTHNGLGVHRLNLCTWLDVAVFGGAGATGQILTDDSFVYLRGATAIYRAPR